MCHFLNLVELFQRPAVLIGQQDKHELKEMYTSRDGRSPRFTHWLVVLLWCEERETDGWKVMVFPVSEEKVFWMVPPLFRTMEPSSFENAWKLSEAIRASCQSDQLTLKFAHPYWDNWNAI